MRHQETILSPNTQLWICWSSNCFVWIQCRHWCRCMNHLCSYHTHYGYGKQFLLVRMLCISKRNCKLDGSVGNKDARTLKWEERNKYICLFFIQKMKCSANQLSDMLFQNLYTCNVCCESSFWYELQIPSGVPTSTLLGYSRPRQSFWRRCAGGWGCRTEALSWQTVASS